MQTAQLLMVSAALLAMAAPRIGPPTPHGAVPTARQVKWHELQVYGFLHFTVNAFTDKEWGYGDEPESVFNPTDFDADQIVRTARDAGLRGLVLTCKHHDGFCLWPSAFTEHSVKNSPWKGGKGDVVREISDACHRYGLKFGVYLSPWDRNHAQYGRPEYITYYRNQLRELLTNYGPIFEVWFDGANGGDGYYGGARETRHIDNTTYYDWPNTIKIVRELQPDACMFSDGGPDVRWVGNESGFAGDPCWATIDAQGYMPGHADARVLNHGTRNGAMWLPAEVDVSIRPGWFYHPKEDGAVKSVEKLTQIYYDSVGRGANLILNIPPDRRGRIPDADARNLREWGARIKSTFSHEFTRRAKATASNTRGGDRRFVPSNVVDGKRETYWSTDDAETTPELTLDLAKPAIFNVVRLSEYIELGQRVVKFAIDTWQNGAWKQLTEGTSIGSERLLRVPTTTTTRVRLRITESPVCPAIAELGLFLDPGK